MKKIFFILILLFSTVLIWGQNTKLKGQVFDKLADKKLSHASIYVEELNIGTYANEEGFFELKVPLLESFTIRVEHIGFESIVKTIPGNKIQNIQIGMVSTPIIIEGILVEGIPAQRTTQSTIISDPTKKFSQPKDIGDMFKNVPGFGVIKRGGYAMDPVFRSFRHEQLNIQYDGGIQVMHACPNRMDPITTHVMPNEVERIELIKGPYSVRYGQTMGGVMNIITTQPQHSDKLSIGGSLEGGFEFNSHSKLTRLSLDASGKTYDFVVSGGLRDAGNYKNGEDVEIPTSYKSYNYSAKAGFEPSKNQRLQIGWRQSFGRDILHVGLPMDTKEDNSGVFSVDYVVKNVNPKLYGITFKGFLSKVGHIMGNENRPNFRMVDAVTRVDALTAGGKLEFSLTPIAKTQIYAGLDFRYLARDGERVRLVKRNAVTGQVINPPMRKVDLIWQDATVNNWGIFLENKFFVSEKWTITMGARLDYVTSELKIPAPDFVELYPDFDNSTQWNFGATVTADSRLGNDWNFQIALGRGTRTATMEERYINHFQVGADAYEYVGNPYLKPEANHQIDMNFKKSTETWEVEVSVFYSYLSNFITAAVDTTLVRKFLPRNLPQNAKLFQNIDQAYQAGFELVSKIQIANNLTTYASVAYTHAQNMDWNEPLPEIPPLTTTFGIRFENESWTTDLRGRFATKQNRIASSFSETETPNFTVFDFRAGLRPMRNLSLGAAVLNILDTNFYEHLNRGYRNSTEQGLIYEPGRNMTFFLKYVF